MDPELYCVINQLQFKPRIFGGYRLFESLRVVIARIFLLVLMFPAGGLADEPAHQDNDAGGVLP